MNKLILLASCEQKQGKTILGFELAKKLGEKHKVQYVDIARSEKSLAMYLGIESNVVYDFVDVMEGTCQVEEATIPVEINGVRAFDLVPSPRLKSKTYRSSELIEKIALIFGKSYDYTIIDGIHLYQDENYFDYNSVHRILFLTEAKTEDLKKIDGCIQKIGKEKLEHVIMVLNKYVKADVQKGLMYRQKELEEMLKIRIRGTISRENTLDNVDRIEEISETSIKEYRDAVSVIMNHL